MSSSHAPRTFAAAKRNQMPTSPRTLKRSLLEARRCLKDGGTRRSTPTRYRALGLGALLQRAWPQRRRGLGERSALGATLVTLPNGSRLSCGRNARGRKAVERQTKRLAGEATQFLPLVSARQLQALVRQRTVQAAVVAHPGTSRRA